MMTGTTPLLLVLALAFVVMVATWWLQVRTRNAGYVDVAWAGLMGTAALLYGVLGQGATTPRLLVAILGGLWGFRLCLHLLTRVLHEADLKPHRRIRNSIHMG